jgi:hypothetical protein
MPEPWEQAFALIADYGQEGARQFVVAGMCKAPAGAEEQVLEWEAVEVCLHAIATETRH